MTQTQTQTQNQTITLAEIAAHSPTWADHIGRLAILWQDEAESAFGAYYLVSGANRADQAQQALAAAAAHIQRYDPPEITETQRGDILRCYSVRTALDLRTEFAADPEIVSMYQDDDDEIVLFELDSMSVTWQPSEPPCIAEDGREYSGHQWHSPDVCAHTGGGMVSISDCPRCSVLRVTETSPANEDRDYPTLTLSYCEGGEGGEPLLRDGVID